MRKLPVDARAFFNPSILCMSLQGSKCVTVEDRMRTYKCMYIRSLSIPVSAFNNQVFLHPIIHTTQL